MRGVSVPWLAALLVLAAIFASAILLWDNLSGIIMAVLSSWYTTAFLWGVVLLPTLIHYVRFKPGTGEVSDKLNPVYRPLEYVWFFFQYSAILTALQTIGKELFAYWNFPDKAAISSITGLDIAGFIATLVVLMVYAYSQLAPVISESIGDEKLVPQSSPEANANERG